MVSGNYINYVYEYIAFESQMVLDLDGCNHI